MEYQSLWQITKTRVWSCILFFFVGSFLSSYKTGWSFSLKEGLVIAIIFFIAVPLMDYITHLRKLMNHHQEKKITLEEDIQTLEEVE